MAMTAMFRAIGSAFGTFNNASKVSGLIVSITVTYAGYIIYKVSSVLKAVHHKDDLKLFVVFLSLFKAQHAS